MCFLTGITRENVMYQTPTCLDSFAFGALLAILLRRSDGGRLRRVAWLVLLASATIIVLRFSKKELWESNAVLHSAGLTVISLAYACLIYLLRTSAPGAWGVGLFDNAFLKFFGKYSFGLYVFHGLMMPLLDRWIPADRLLAFFHSPVLATVVCVTGKVGASLAVAMLSWHLLEAPCLRVRAAE